jgi:hypothetical protein
MRLQADVDSGRENNMLLFAGVKLSGVKVSSAPRRLPGAPGTGHSYGEIVAETEED